MLMIVSMILMVFMLIMLIFMIIGVDVNENVVIVVDVIFVNVDNIDVW